MTKVLKRYVYEYDRTIFMLLAALLVLSVLSYILFLTVAISGVVARKSTESASNELLTKISSLEATYVMLDGGIHLDRAKQMGFMDTKEPRYVDGGEENKNFTILTTVR
jgi:hypothetical protein